MMNKNKLAFLLAIVLLVTCTAGCSKVTEEEEASSGVVDMGGVAGEEIEVDVPDAPAGNDAEEPKEEQQEESKDEPAGEEPKDEPAKDEPKEEPKKEPTEEQPKDDKEEKPNYGDLFEENEVVKPAYDESKELVVVSYNIKNAWGSTTIDQIVSQINAAGADIVGFQEVDLYKPRSKNIDQIKTLADKAGFPYYYFEPTFVGGNNQVKADPDAKTDAYGHAVMSKYPIKKSEIIWPKAQSEKGEIRNFGRHEIDVDGTTIVFYNGHLDFSKGRDQYLEIQEYYMANDEYAICVGDFNEKYTEFGAFFDFDKFYNFAFGDDDGGSLVVTRGEEKNQLIDHIVVTKDKFVWKDGGLGNGLYQTEHDGASDHHMIYCHLNIIK